jgi:hypothetical protein
MYNHFFAAGISDAFLALGMSVAIGSYGGNRSGGAGITMTIVSGRSSRRSSSVSGRICRRSAQTQLS